MFKRIMGLIIACIMLFTATAFALPEGVPSSLEAPQIIKMELKKHEDGKPYFYLEYKIPQSVLDLDAAKPTDGWASIEDQRKLDNGEWEDYSGGHLDVVSQKSVVGKPGVFGWEIELEDEGGLTETVINSRNYSFRSRLTYTYYYGEGPGEFADVVSPWSNEVSSKSGSFYKGASDWAVAELDKAQTYGFITDKIKDNMSGPITREEFAEVAVKLYDKYTGKAAAYNDMSAFTDTQNPEIFKAFNLKIVNGTNLEKKLFSPKDLTNRQQVAAMLFRAVKAIKSDADFSTAGAENFSDVGLIESYAVDPVKFMSKNGFIKGSGGKFDPQGTCTREMAVLIAVRVYEKYAGK